MTLHRAHGLALQPPPGWHVQVVDLFSGAPEEDFAPHLLVVRDVLAEGDDLAAYVDREAAKLARRLPRFALDTRRVRSTASGEAVELAFTWVDGTRAVAQRQLYAATTERGVATLTVTTLPGYAASHAETIDALFASVCTGITPR